MFGLPVAWTTPRNYDSDYNNNHRNINNRNQHLDNNSPTTNLHENGERDTHTHTVSEETATTATTVTPQQPEAKVKLITSSTFNAQQL
jgi:hypothetical protein